MAKSTSLVAPAPEAIAVKPRVAPGPKGCVLFGSMSEMRDDALGLLTRSAAEFGDVVRLKLVLYVHLLNHPDHVKHVLQDANASYKKDLMYDRMRPLVGNGLLTSEGDFWRRQRRLAQPAFHKQRLAGFAETMRACTASALDGWAAHARTGEPIDAAAEMMALALRIVGKTLFSADLGGDARDVGAALGTALEVTNERFQQIFVLPKLPTKMNRRFNAAMKVLDGVVGRVIAERRASGQEHPDLLSMLMSARDEETGEAMDDAQLRDELMTLFLAGHETTANALSWTFFLLSKSPQVQERLEAEVDRALAGRAPTVADLPKLPYTLQVVQEAMRLYPPAWLMSREALAEDAIGGFRIPKGSSVMLGPYVTHRHPAFWDNPEGFDPDRFTPQAIERRPRYAYFPFAGGPRQCIGSNFALMEAQVILAMAAQRYRLHLVPFHPVEPEPSVTLRPKGGIKMTVKARA